MESVIKAKFAVTLSTASVFSVNNASTLSRANLTASIVSVFVSKGITKSLVTLRYVLAALILR